MKRRIIIKKIIKATILSIALSLLLITISNNSASASEISNTTSIDTEIVKDFLGENQENIDKFNKLSKNEQQQFIEALKDQELFEENIEIVTNDTKLNSAPEFTSNNNDLVESNLITTAATSYRNEKTSKETLRFFGIDVLQYSHRIVWQTKNGVVTKFYENKATVEHSYVPSTVTYLDKKNDYISGGRGYANATFSYEVGIKGYAAKIGNIKHRFKVGHGTIYIDQWGV